MSDVQKINLASCPFCGEIPIEEGKSDYLRIRCQDCGTMGHTFPFDADDDAEIEKAQAKAVAAWNRRAPAEGSPSKPEARDYAKILDMILCAEHKLISKRTRHRIVDKFNERAGLGATQEEQ